MAIRPVPLLTLTIGIVGANSLVLPPIAVAVAADLGSAAPRVITAMSAYGLGTVISALLLAPRADRIGADRVLRQATALLCLALLAVTLAPGVFWLQAAHGLAGLAAGMALPAIYGLAAYVAPEGREKEVIGKVLTGWTLSLVGGVALAALMADLFGWRSLYAVLATVTALDWLLLRRCDFGATGGDAGSSPLTALRVPGVLRGLFANVMLMLAFFGAYAFLGSHVVQVLAKSTSAAGILTMSYGAGFGLAVWGDRYIDRLPRNHAMALAFAGLCLTHLGIALAAPSYLALLITVFIWGIFQHFALNAVLERLSGLELRQRGAIMGLNSASTYLCVTAGALAFGPVYATAGLVGCVLIAAFCCLLASLESLLPRSEATRAQQG